MTTQQNRITDLFGIQYPIIQGGMVWCSGWRLASAVSNAGGLGLLGAGSMHPDKLLEHIHKMQDATERPWGINVPLIAAGGIGSGQAMLAARALGAEGVQIGTLFAVSKESSAADSFKRKCLLLEEGDTMLALKKLSPTRLVRNDLYARIVEAEDRGASAEELHELLGKAASKRGIFEGDIENGELEIGQIVTSIQKIDSVTDIMSRLIREYDVARQQIIDNV